MEKQEGRESVSLSLRLSLDRDRVTHSQCSRIGKRERRMRERGRERGSRGRERKNEREKSWREVQCPEMWIGKSRSLRVDVSRRKGKVTQLRVAGLFLPPSTLESDRTAYFEGVGTGSVPRFTLELRSVTSSHTEDIHTTTLSTYSFLFISLCSVDSFFFLHNALHNTCYCCVPVSSITINSNAYIFINFRLSVCLCECECFSR